MAPGHVFVDHTTVSAQITRHLAGIAAAQGIGFVDAPRLGRAGRGRKRRAFGDVRRQYRPITPRRTHDGRLCPHLPPSGDSGAGQLAKMMNQICIAGLMQGLSEALAFGEKAGLDGEKVVEVISQGAAGSWQMVNRHKTMLKDEFDFGFAVDWMRKDLGICLKTADEIGARCPSPRWWISSTRTCRTWTAAGTTRQA
jgi:3-hydroxyisobutyrate dehydrogenase